MDTANMEVLVFLSDQYQGAIPVVTNKCSLL